MRVRNKAFSGKCDHVVILDIVRAVTKNVDSPIFRERTLEAHKTTESEETFEMLNVDHVRGERN